MVKVSVIVPVYGVERYLRKCLDSLVSQTLEDIEIILINDASPDNCHLIMQEYEEKYPQIIKCIYSKENRKQGGARNLGLKIAKGEYIMFVDSDDWVDPNICEKLYKQAILEGNDLVYCDYIRVREDNGNSRYMMEVCKEQTGILTVEKRKSLFGIIYYPVAQLIHRNIIIGNNILFAEGIRYEDKVAVPFYFLYAKNAGKINEGLYFYNIRDDSTSFKRNEEYHFDRMTAAMLSYHKLIERGFYDIYHEEIDMNLIWAYFKMLDYCIYFYDDFPIDKVREIRDDFIKYCPKYRENFYVNKVMEPFSYKIAKLNDVSPNLLLQERKLRNKGCDSYLAYYKEVIDKTETLFQYIKLHRYKCALWGAGPKGIDFLKVSDPYNLKVDYVVDLDPEKQGNTLQTGHTVTNFKHIKNDVDVILVPNKNHYGDIYNTIKSYSLGVYVVNLDVYLIYRINMDDFFRTKI